MAIENNHYVRRAGLLPGRNPGDVPGERYYKELFGFKHVPYNRETDYRPLGCVSTVLRTLSYALTPETIAVYGHSFAGARRRWSGQPSIKWDVSEASLLNRARSRLVDKLSATAQAEWMTTLGEGRQSVRMINNRTQQLNRASGYLDNGTIRGARMCERTLGVRPLPKRKIKKYLRFKQLGGLWLEYWMGWAPLVGDVRTGLENLATLKVLEPKAVRASARSWGSGETLPRGSGTYAGGTVMGQKSIMMRAVLKGFNPNERLLRDLGLVNVAVTIHDLIPWSWMLNWFVNTGEVLRQYSDLYGITLEKGTVVRSRVETRATRHYLRQPAFEQGLNSRVHRRVDFRREVLIDLPEVRLRLDFSGLSLTRSLTVWSLITQRLYKWAN